MAAERFAVTSAPLDAVPLTAAEIVHAARTYPIVFSAAAPTVPFAVVGLRDHEKARP